MRYTAFDQMQDGTHRQQEGETDQAYMERILSEIFTDHGEKKMLNDYTNPRFLSCSAEEKSLTVGFTVDQWVTNPNGSLHGGMIATDMDIACGTLIRYYARANGVVTTNLNVNYVRGVQQGEDYTVTAFLDKCGRRLHFLHAYAQDSQGRLLATCTAQFMCIVRSES